jgi:1-acyl-sn-glycerol-3-phosphate acyltransferase
VRDDQHAPVPAPGALWPNLRIRPRARFGEPLDFSRYHGRESDGHLLRAVTDEIMQAIAKLSGQDYVDIDARRAKAELAGGGASDDPGDADYGGNGTV